MTTPLGVLQDTLWSAWQPRPHLSVSEIASKHLYLSPEYSKEAGYVNLSRYPFANEIMDRLSPDDPCKVVVFRAGIQSSKSMIGQAFLTSIITQNPAPTLWVTDTDGKAQLFSRLRLDLMIRDDPLLRSLVADSKSRNKDNTIHTKMFPGGNIQLVGAQSASGLTSNTYRFVVVDELEDHRANLSYAGSSAALAMGRQTTFGDLAKTLIVSSPKVKGDSEIDSWHDRGDRRVFMIPCPHCGGFQTLRWRDEGADGAYRLIWDKGDPSSARYVCCLCSKEFVDSDKNIFLPAGKWEPTIIDLPDQSVTSYSLSALYLPFGSYSWPDMVRQFESAALRLKSGDTEEMRTWVNTRLAQSFEAPADSIDPRSLMALVEPDWEKVPNGITDVVCSTDVQGDRIETLTLGVGAGYELWVLGYNVILSDPIDLSTWARNDEVLQKKWTREDGTVLKTTMAVVDAGDGNRIDSVYNYCNRSRRKKRAIYAIKGKEGRRPIWDKKLRHGKIKDGNFYLVGSDSAKDLLHSFLSVRTPGPRYIHVQEHILKEYPDFFDQLTAEKREKKRDDKGRERWAWVRIGGRKAEVLDCFVYCLGAIHCLIQGGRPLDKVLPPPTADDPQTKIEGLTPEPTSTSEDPSWQRCPKPLDPVVGNKPTPRRPPAPKAGWINGGGKGRGRGNWF